MSHGTLAAIMAVQSLTRHNREVLIGKAERTLSLDQVQDLERRLAIAVRYRDRQVASRDRKNAQIPLTANEDRMWAKRIHQAQRVVENVESALHGARESASELKKSPLANGVRVKLLRMENDPNPVAVGTQGTVVRIDGKGTIHVKWDNGRFLGMVPGEDDWKILDGEA
jgi:hypothetical protein